MLLGTPQMAVDFEIYALNFVICSLGSFFILLPEFAFVFIAIGILSAL